MSSRVKCITLTILTESPVPLSYDQGYGNYTPIKKEQYKNKIHAKTSVSTFTYDLRRILHQNYGWTLSNIVLNKNSKGEVTNLYAHSKSIESVDEYGLESDVFGYFVPSKGKGSLTKVSPLRVIPFRSLNPYKNTTQLITNKGFLESELKRSYYDNSGKEILRDSKFPMTQALAVEEVMADYYVYTVTLELDRIGVIEVQDGKLLLPEERKYMDKKIREKAVRDILDALTIFTRNIKHSSVLLKPLIVIGGAFDKVVPFFWDDVIYNNENNSIDLTAAVDTIESYGLEKENVIFAVDKRVNIFEEYNYKIDDYPIRKIKELGSRLEIKEDNMWYLT